VLVGEPGVGKTALLEDTLASLSDAPDLRVLRATGLETERHIPFAGLLQLLRPALGSLPELSPPQAEALSAALALSEGRNAGGDRFVIGAAVLTVALLSTLAAALVVVIVTATSRAAHRRRRNRTSIHERADIAREVDDLELIYALPAYDRAAIAVDEGLTRLFEELGPPPGPDPMDDGCERLRDAIRDHREGEQP